LGLRDTLVVREATRKSMRGNRGTDTKPELLLRRSLWSAGIRGYRKNVAKLPGKPDVVFGRAKLAVFVHGCYWHQCPHCKRNLTPSTNSAYWAAKFQANRERDELQKAALEAADWQVLVLWECEVKRGEGLGRVRQALARQA
jgi:DNA mismatch endonuclease (patch repair protein)